MKIINNVEEFIIRHNFASLNDFAKRNKLNYKTLLKIKSTEPEVFGSLEIRTLMRICDIFNCKLSQLIDYEPDNYNNSSDE